MNCVFCTNPGGAGTLLEEDERTWVLVHPQGQLMIVAKRHVENVSDLDVDEWLHVARVWHRAESDLRAKTGAERVIVMKLGLQTPHLHIHLYPFPSASTRDDVFDVIEGRATPRLTLTLP